MSKKSEKRRTGSRRWVCPNCNKPSPIRQVKNNVCPQCKKSSLVDDKGYTLDKAAPKPTRSHNPRKRR